MKNNDQGFLTIEQISASYGQSEDVVKQVSFSLNYGELGCLLGPSGCGKTTILRALSGFQDLNSGRIVLDGVELSNNRLTLTPESRQVGMVFQDHALFPHLTVADNVRFGLSTLPSNSQTTTINTMLDLVGLKDHANKYPHELSGGQSQRVALARAIAPQPKLLLLDEPFSSLDAELRESLGHEVRSLLKELQITTIMVTHDQYDAFALGDKIGVMSDGKLLQWDNSFNLYHAPNSRFVANFIGDGIFVDGTMLNDNVVITSLGEIRGETINNISAGEKVDLLIRPDDVKYNLNGAIHGKVCRKAFKGAQTLYTLHTDSGDELMSLVPSHDDYEIGDIIRVNIEADHLVCFAQNQ